MRGIFAPQRFSGFLLLFCLLIVGSGFRTPTLAPTEALKNVIIIIEDVVFSYNPEEGPIWIAANPSSVGEWVKVKGEETIDSFRLTDDQGNLLAEEEVGSDTFKFKLEGYEAGYYYGQFFLNGDWHIRTLVIEE